MAPFNLPRISDVNDLKGKRVIVRASLDVPLEDGVVTNEFRVVKSIPTLVYLRDKGAKIILITHIGRDPKTTLAPLVPVLEKHLTISYVPALEGDMVTVALASLQDGEVLMLENLRSHEGEESNSEAFAKQLASYADYYVDDAFAVAHREHASIVGIPKYIPGYAGITFAEEYENLSRALSPEHPALFILGGAKFETKAPLIERYADSYETVFLGGALANDFLKGLGNEVGMSLVSPVDLSCSPLIHRENIIIPIDVVVKGEGGAHEVEATGVLTDEKILDIGMKTIEILVPYIRSAKTILWNGPLGYYEGGYDEATMACAKLIAESDAYSVVGGGDTVAAIEALNLSDKFSFLSTAGGAMLTFLEKGSLPGIDILIR
jgi:phosphoglycerate kinase